MGILDTLSKAADQILNSNTTLLEKTGIKKPKANSTSRSSGSGSGSSSTRSSSSNNSDSSTSTRTASQTYTVKRGDTLSGIAKKFYGKASLYPEIFDANRGILDDPDKISVGQKLRIPDLG